MARISLSPTEWIQILMFVGAIVAGAMVYADFSATTEENLKSMKSEMATIKQDLIRHADKDEDRRKSDDRERKEDRESVIIIRQDLKYIIQTLSKEGK